MFFFLSKIFQFLLAPIVWIMVVIALGLYAKQQRVKRRLFASAFIALLFFSNSFICDEALRLWEVRGVHRDSLPSFDYAIVLGGMASYDAEFDRLNYNPNIERIMSAIDLYRSNKVKKILLTGGSGSIIESGFKESAHLKKLLLTLNIPDSAIVVEDKSRNTRENARFTGNLFLHDTLHTKYLLISSSFHVRRAVGCFRKAGIQAVVYPTNRFAGPRKFTPDHLFIPDVGALGKWTLLIHEVTGYLIYKVMGYA